MRLAGPLLRAFTALALAGLGLPLAMAADGAPQERRARLIEVALSGPWPDDLLRPEGKTRWDLMGITTGAARIVSTVPADGSVAVRESAEPQNPAMHPADAPNGAALRPRSHSADAVAASAPPSGPTGGATGGDASTATGERTYTDPTGGDAALRWLYPDRFPDSLRIGERHFLDLEEAAGGPPDRLRIEMESVGVGWMHLRSGPREVALQRILILRKSASSPGYQPDVVIHRWVDPLAGVVAEIQGPAAPDGRSRRSVSRARVLDTLLTPAASLKIHLPELTSNVLGNIIYGWDRGSGTTVASLTPEHYPTIGALIAANSWNFSADNSGSELVTYSTPLSGPESCNVRTCAGGSNAGTSCDKPADCPGGTCARKICKSGNTVGADCNTDSDCPQGGSQSCAYVACSGGTNAGAICDSASDCPGGSCAISGCGYGKLPSGGGFQPAQLDRRDKNPATSLQRFNSVSQVEVQSGKAVIWLRAGSQKEGIAGAFGTGESRFCYYPYDDNGDGTLQAKEKRSQVPNWVLGHNDNDGKGFYMQAGDTFQNQGTCAGGSNPGGLCVRPEDCPGGACNGTFACEQAVFNQVCGLPQTVDRLYIQGCTVQSDDVHAGMQTGANLKNGVVTLPSGHTFNAILSRVVADFCVYPVSSCILRTAAVRTVTYLWQVPNLGTLVRLQSAQKVPDMTSFTTLDETEIEFGLFPPRTIQATAATNTSVTLAWDPGIDAHRITGYKVYWGTQSGVYSSSATITPGSARSTTVTGLTPGTPYFFTVTSLSDYTRPKLGLPVPPPETHTFESIVYPTQVYGDPTFVYPIELAAPTSGGSCMPTTEATGVKVTKSGASIQICWDPVFDRCLTGYRILGAANPDSAANYSTVADVGLTTCWTGNASQRFFLVVARGTGGTGPWGAYGR